MHLLIFDLDGTLIDSQLDLANAVNASRGHLGLPPIANELVFSYVGDGAPVLIRRALGPEASAAEVDRALQFFLAYYRDHMLDHTTLYPGVREALDRLHSSGRQMAVLTNKPVRFSETLVERLGLGAHFQRVYGGNSFPEKKPHPMGIRTLLGELNAEASDALMVGDSAVDVRTARNAGIRACGVTFGFQPETFEEHPPDFLVDDMSELADIVLAAG
ncbi:MAG: phosphoglycolate phosphatase [Acidobacteriia bacterium]|nr:phosphoglycolate phosphatase [Terriglobia bacterium]